MTEQNSNTARSKIKEQGYWEINIRPTVYREDRLSKERIKGIVRSATVELRGWDYPHFRGQDNHDPYPIQNGIENWVIWQNHIEFWRMTASGNFLHLLALREDWTDLKEFPNMWSQGNELQGKKVLGVTGTLYTLTEIFEFTKRLGEQGIFDELVVVDVTFHNILNRSLVVDSYNKVPFSYDRISHTNKRTMETCECSVSELLSKSNEFSLNALKQLFWVFDWENPPMTSLKGDQDKFLRGRL